MNLIEVPIVGKNITAFYIISRKTQVYKTSTECFHHFGQSSDILEDVQQEPNRQNHRKIAHFKLL